MAKPDPDNFMPYVEKRMLKGGDYTFMQHMPKGFNRESAGDSYGNTCRSTIRTGERMTLGEYSKIAGRSTIGHSSLNVNGDTASQ